MDKAIALQTQTQLALSPGRVQVRRVWKAVFVYRQAGEKEMGERRRQVTIALPGKATHYRLSSGATACGIVGAEYAAHDSRDCDCRRCMKTEKWKASMGLSKQQKAFRLGRHDE